MKYLVYLIHNRTSEKIYIGYTSDFLKRWKTHCETAKSGANFHLSRAIRKYGELTFSYEFLNENLILEEAKLFEKLWILTLNSYNPKVGYNMTMGGDGWHGFASYSDEEKTTVIEKRRAGLRKRWQNPTGKQIMAYSKISEKLRGRQGHIDVKRGMTHTHFYGPEKAAIISKKLSIANTGIKKGVWVTNGLKNKVVEETKILEGWWRGRTQKRYERKVPVSQQTILKMSKSLQLSWERKRRNKLLQNNSPAPVTGVLNQTKIHVNEETTTCQC